MRFFLSNRSGVLFSREFRIESNELRGDAAAGRAGDKVFDDGSGFRFAEMASGECRQHVFVKVRANRLSKRICETQMMVHHATQPLALFVALRSGHLPLISFCLY